MDSPQETAAIDCQNSGAMFSSGATVATAIVALVKPRRIPGLVDNPRRSLNVLFTEACGNNMLAVAMVSDVHYWTTPDPTDGGKIHSTISFDGFDWAARCVEYWKAHFGLTSVQTVRTALKAVEKSGLLECENRFFNGNMWPHYRLSAKAVAILDADQQRRVDGRGVESNTPDVEINTPITNRRHTEKTKNLKTTSASGTAPLAKGETSQSLQGGGKQQNQKPALKAVSKNPAQLTNTKQQGDQKGSTSEPPTIGKSGKRLLGWAQLWEKLTTEPDDPNPRLLSETEANQLKQVGTQLWKQHIDLRDVLAHVLPRWNTFAWRARSDAGLSAKADTPDVGFFQANYGTAVRLMLDAKAVAA
ncbi:hypothetical protein BurMR1_3045 [Burkholderia sp. MR1]|nr:hypothetical protein BurMR1_3045 [Burkholderia sp. MR1]